MCGLDGFTELPVRLRRRSGCGIREAATEIDPAGLGCRRGCCLCTDRLLLPPPALELGRLCRSQEARPTTVCAHTGCPLAPGWPRKVGLKPRSRGVGLRRDPAPSGAPSRKQPEERCSGLSRPACEVGVGMGLHHELRGESGPEMGSLSARRALGSTPGGGE